jgi:hypothetical protein
MVPAFPIFGIRSCLPPPGVDLLAVLAAPGVVLRYHSFAKLRPPHRFFVRSLFSDRSVPELSTSDGPLVSDGSPARAGWTARERGAVLMVL